ncbi:hypothetical protein M5U04_19345 [Xenorhabdus sp. XENO-1]|uniref:hypothetical protein n=1 Tax=Xenorhabdus bovienii TaxID=40576 RepID=UPI0020CA3BE2|nr:hypothetical protein [Xenorhabdus bovienii]MCP9270173.1 hypothetical protein [Xenorhabdus bovienii subsp. africana]
MFMGKAKQQRDSSYVAGYFDGYRGNCYCIGTGAQVFRLLYHKGYVKGSNDAAKRTAKYRAAHMRHGKNIFGRVWHSLWQR